MNAEPKHSCPSCALPLELERLLCSVECLACAIDTAGFLGDVFVELLD